MNLPAYTHIAMSKTRYSLEWASEDVFVGTEIDGDSQLNIPPDCIVDVFPPYAHHDYHQVAYVTISDSPADAKIETRTSLEVIAVPTLPSDVIERYAAESQWFLPALLDNKHDHANLHVIISGKSGGELARTVYDALLAPYFAALGLKEGEEYVVHETTSASFISDLATGTFLPRAQTGIPQSIVLLSGDGGIVDLINGLLSSGDRAEKYVRPELAVLPLGTGNALAHSTGVTADRTLGMSTLARGRPKPLPLFKAHFSPGSRPVEHGEAVTEPEKSTAVASVENDSPVVFGAVVLSYGLHASLVGDSDTPEYRKHGAKRFAMAAEDLLHPPNNAPPHAYQAKVSTRDSKHEWKTVDRSTQAYVLATFASKLEAGFTISPASRPLDGKLRLIHFGPLEGGGDAIMEIMMAAYGGGKHVDDERVSYEEIEALKIDFDVENDEEEERWRRVCVDGKIFVVPRRGHVVVEKETDTVLDLVTLAT